MATQLPHLPEIEKLSPRVTRILGGNPSKFTLQGTNTYLLGTSTQRILLDTGEGKPSWSTALSSVLNATSPQTTFSQVLLTHWHPDHTGGCSQLLSLCPNAKIYENDPPDPEDGRSVEPISDGQVFKVEGATLRALHTPGHTNNHMCFVLEEEGVMFTGDNVLGHGTAVFEDLATYMQSLEKMKAEFEEKLEGKGRAYPGHGAVIEDGSGKVKEYIQHRKERETQVLQVLKEFDDQGGATVMEIVKVIYKDYPENLWEPAAGGILQILMKLEDEGKVEDVGEDKWRVNKKATL